MKVTRYYITLETIYNRYLRLQSRADKKMAKSRYDARVIINYHSFFIRLATNVQDGKTTFYNYRIQSKFSLKYGLL